ncbi:hypothetical protein [Phenylobacterium sp.]|uniref:hypothetical protein n=1 Tax=Phenylobacterium sp. TaxID=1871053 RepID=UPI003BACC2E9
MDYIPIQPGRRRAPRELILMSGVEGLLALVAGWVALARTPVQETADHRELIVAAAGNTLPLALLVFPALAWLAFHRRADGAVWPLLWSPALWAVLMIAGS